MLYKNAFETFYEMKSSFDEFQVNLIQETSEE